MKRLHVHVNVADLDQSVRFYSTLFGVPPTVLKTDYAKWMLEDPRANFAISTSKAPGLNHVGIQAESSEDLAAIARRLKAAGEQTTDQAAVTCCYAKSDKSWVRDPSNLRWETFFTFGEATTYGESEGDSKAGSDASSSCCKAA